MQQGWAETQLYLAHGLHVIQIGNRKPDGALDLMAACDYAHSVLQVPRERIVVLAGSTATTVALEAALRRPDGMGILALTGVMSAPAETAESIHPVTPRFRLLAFHGEKDRSISPEAARAILEQLVGASALRPPHGLWHVFPAENHSLNQFDSSVATIHATILRELGLIQEPER